MLNLSFIRRCFFYLHYSRCDLIRLLCFFSWCCCGCVYADYDDEYSQNQHSKRNQPKTIAIIGGGISGSFVTKYLVDYDQTCTKIDTITIFDPYPVIGPITAATTTRTIPSGTGNDDNDGFITQGSRVQSFQLNDGSNVELGASIGYKGFYHVLDLIHNDDTIQITEPFSTGVEPAVDELDDVHRDGFGIYSGNGKWPLITSGITSSQKKMKLALRYNWDLYTVTNVCKDFLTKWSTLPLLLDDAIHFFDSPDSIWEALKLKDAVHKSFDQLLDSIGVSSDSSWLKKILPYQGSLRSELLTAVNLVNYNQNNAGVNGIVGMGSFAASLGGLFSIKGGNYKIIQSAFRQATKNRSTNCLDNNKRSNNETIVHITKRITTVVGGLEGFNIYSDQELLGKYDIVVLAAPIQLAQITFLIQSHFDPAVVQPMPLGGLIDAHNEGVHAGGGREVLPVPMPPITNRPYKQVTTTIISNANVTVEFLSYPPSSVLPKSILMTTDGKYELYNITSISCIRKGLYKMFSDTPIDESIRNKLFGVQHIVEYVRVWGSSDKIKGGATPDYQGQGTSSGFLLYDGAFGLQGHTTSGALYYPVAMEQSSLASMEIAAVGAKAVAKLIAQRIGMIQPHPEKRVFDEL